MTAGPYKPYQSQTVRRFGVMLLVPMFLYLSACGLLPDERPAIEPVRHDPPPARDQGEPTAIPVVRPSNPDVVGDLMPDVHAQSPRRADRITCVIDGDIADLLVILNAYDVQVVMLPEDMGRELKTRYESASVESILQGLAVRLGPEAGVYQRADHVYVGIPRDEDVGLRLYHLPYEEAGEVLSFYTQAVTTSGFAAAVGDMVLVKDTPTGIQRVDALHELVASPRRSYELEVVYAEITAQQADALGVDLEAAGTSLLDLRLGDLQDAGVTLSLAASIQSILTANGGDAQTREWQTARLHLVESKGAEMQVGDTINIRRRVVSPEGTVTEADTQTFSTGFILKVNAHAVRGGLVQLDLTPEVSNVRNFVDGVPQISTRRFTSTVYAGDGAVVVLGGLTANTDRDSLDRVPYTGRVTGRDRTADRSRLFIFIRINEVF